LKSIGTDFGNGVRFFVLIEQTLILYLDSIAIVKKMLDFKITKATLDNLDLLQKISKQTFFETFAAFNSKENMKQYLNESLSLEQLKLELENEFSAFYFAYNEQEVIGYLKINRGEAQTEIKDDHSMEIERIYVLAIYQGKKVGKALFEKAIQIAKSDRKNSIRLGVWEKNEKAIQFYLKNGFEIFDKHIFKLGEDLQTDLLMIRKL
jgi:ribosomal protein S18 acetylase RimI-like enzyme